MACSKYILTNTGSTYVNFNYRRCDDSMWEYQVELAPNQSKNIWLINNTYSIAPSFSNTVVLVNEGVFPAVSTSQTQTPTPTPTPTQTATPTNTPTNTQTPSQTQTGTPTQTPTNTETPTNTPTPTQTPTNTETPTNTPTPTQTQTQTQTGTPTQTPTQTHTQTGTPTQTPTQTQTQTGTSTPTPTPTHARFSFTVYPGTTSDSACGQYNSSVTIYGDKAIFDENTIFYDVLSGPTRADMTGYYNNSQTIIQLDSNGVALGVFTLCATLTPTPTQTQTPTNTPTNTATNTQTPTPTTTPTATFGYYTYSLGTGSTANLACADFSSAPNTIYGTVSGGIGPNVGEYLYFDTLFQTPVMNGYYSNGIAWYQVTGGLGQITSSDPNGCLVFTDTTFVNCTEACLIACVVPYTNYYSVWMTQACINSFPSSGCKVWLDANGTIPFPSGTYNKGDGGCFDINNGVII